MAFFAPANDPVSQPLPEKPKAGLESVIAVFWGCDHHLVHPVNEILSKRYGDQLLSYRDIFDQPHTVFWDIYPKTAQAKTIFALVCKELGTIVSAFLQDGFGGKEKGKENRSPLRTPPNLAEVIVEALAVSKKYESQHVALFDYDRMVVISFDECFKTGYVVKTVASVCARRVLLD